MPEIINKIIQQNISLFGENPKIQKINIGFTNNTANAKHIIILNFFILSTPHCILDQVLVNNIIQNVFIKRHGLEASQ